MPAPSTIDEFLEVVRKSGVVDPQRLDAHLQEVKAADALPREPLKLARSLVKLGLLSRFQAEQFLQGKHRGLRIGKYKVLEWLGSGGGGNVFLCEHAFMRHRVAVKVLNIDHAQDPVVLERFYREARAGAALQHPNLVRSYDIDQENGLHYLVMDYVDGTSLRRIVNRFGAMDVTRASHYVRQAAVGLQHAHHAGLVHRDVNPGNLLLDRQGVIKILDLGVARLVHEKEDSVNKDVLVGTADYLAPEQARDSAQVDFRADLYGLGATFYHLLTGRPPFHEAKTLARKLLCHQMQAPPPLCNLRPEVPPGLAAIIEKLLAKDPAARFPNAAAVAEALEPWTQIPIAPPQEREMPARNGTAAELSAKGEVAPAATPPAAGPAEAKPKVKVAVTFEWQPRKKTEDDTAMYTAASGDTKVVRAAAAPPPANKANRPAPARPATASTNGNGANPKALPRLVVVRGNKVNTAYAVREGSNLIGRGGKLPVDIDVTEQDREGPTLPPCCFALLRCEDGQLDLEDLSTEEGTYVNGQRVWPPRRRFRVRPNDVIGIREVQLKVTL